jgi:hypothetical protein
MMTRPIAWHERGSAYCRMHGIRLGSSLLPGIEIARRISKELGQRQFWRGWRPVAIRLHREHYPALYDYAPLVPSLQSPHSVKRGEAELFGIPLFFFMTQPQDVVIFERANGDWYEWRL